MAILKQPASQPGNLAAPPASQVTETIIEATHGWASLRLGDIWEYRDLLIFMTWRDLQARYRQTALGPLWFIIQPVLSMVLYTVVFGNIAKLPSEGQPYAVFTFVALLPWGIFSDAVSATSHSLLGNRHLLSKVYFPRLIPALSRILSSLVDFSIAFVVLVCLLVAYGSTPTWGVLLLPVFLLVAAMTGMAVGLWFAGVIVQYRDFGQIAGLMVRFWMYATPVVYSIGLIPEEWRALYRLNPLTGVIEGFRWALLGTSAPPDWITLLSVLLVVPVLIGGLYHFRRVERTIIDVA